MNKLDSAILHHLSDEYQTTFDAITPYKTVYRVSSGGKWYILKPVKKQNIINNYNYLLAQKFPHVIYPLITKNASFVTRYEHEYYYLTPYVENIDYPLDKRLIDYIQLLHKLHQVTEIKRQFKKEQFLRIYRRQMRDLNHQFLILDEFLRECEQKKNKTNFDWFYLMHYYRLIDLKNILLTLQSKIDQALESIDQFNYALIHNQPSIDHFLVTNEKNYLISLDHSIISMKIYDYIQLFIEYCEYPVDWLDLIRRENISDFEFHYFAFSVIYYLVMNLQVTSLLNQSALISINHFLYTLDVADRNLNLYQNYHQSTSYKVNEGDETNVNESEQ